MKMVAGRTLTRLGGSRPRSMLFCQPLSRTLMDFSKTVTVQDIFSVSARPGSPNPFHAAATEDTLT